MDAIGQAVLVLMYSTTLLIKNDSPAAWMNEWFPKQVSREYNDVANDVAASKHNNAV
jgi:hypothetical protein